MKKLCATPLAVFLAIVSVRTSSHQSGKLEGGAALHRQTRAQHQEVPMGSKGNLENDTQEFKKGQRDLEPFKGQK